MVTTHMAKWLPLNDYSSKYGISLSTLRRRIKAGMLEVNLEKGKYFIKDAPGAKHAPIREPIVKVREASVTSHQAGGPKGLNSQMPTLEQVMSSHQQFAVPSQESRPEVDTQKHGVVTQEIFQELKKAYSKVLSEKEEQIIHLREEINDLKTLVRVFEQENERLKRALHGQFRFGDDNLPSEIE